MGSMSGSDAAPLPRLGEVYFDVRGESRSMRLSWYADTGVAVFSIWQGGTCTGTFRLPIGDLPRMVEALQRGPARDSGSMGEQPPAGQGRRGGPVRDPQPPDIEPGPGGTAAYRTRGGRHRDELAADYPAVDHPPADYRAADHPVADYPAASYGDEPGTGYPGGYDSPARYERERTAAHSRGGHDEELTGVYRGGMAHESPQEDRGGRHPAPEYPGDPLAADYPTGPPARDYPAGDTRDYLASARDPGYLPARPYVAPQALEDDPDEEAEAYQRRGYRARRDDGASADSFPFS